MPYESFALPQFFNRSPPLRVLRLVLDFFLGQWFFLHECGHILFVSSFFSVDLLACEVVGCTSVVVNFTTNDNEYVFKRVKQIKSSLKLTN